MTRIFVFLLLTVSVETFCQEVEIFPDVIAKGDAFVERLAVLSDGYLLTRTMDHINGKRVFDLAKVDLHGNLDESFAKIEVNSNILAVFPQGDKIIVAGPFTEFNGIQKSILRLNADGTIDESFAPASITSGFISSLEKQSNGKMIAVGQFQSGSYKGIARLNEDGSVDNSFIASNPPDGYYMISAIDHNNNIYAVGNSKLMKFDSNGNIQSGFPVAFNGFVSGLTIWGDNVIVTGNFSTARGVPRDDLAVINADGTLGAFTLSTPSPNGLNQSILLPSGKLAASHSNGINLYSLSGTFEKELVHGTVRGIYLDENENIIVIGGNRLRTQEISTPFMVRLTSDLSIDNSFICQPTLTANLTSISGYPDGRFIVGGDFSLGGFNDRFDRIVRINASGNLDQTFNPPSFANVWGVTVQPDGKVLVAAEKLVRLTESGALDNTFHEKIPEETFQGVVRTKLHENLIFTSGSFKIMEGHSSPGIMRLTMDGTVDNSFTSGLPPGSMVYDFDFQSDGKIVVVGAFEIAGVLYGVARLNSNGPLDNSFNKFPIIGNYIRRVIIDGNDKIYAAGEPWKFELNTENLLVKLNDDGSVDENFKSPFTVLDQSINGLEPLDDNHYLIGLSGWFDNSGKSVVTTIDALGNIVDAPYSVPKSHESILATAFDGNTVFLAGRLLSSDKNQVSAIGKIALHKVSGIINDLHAVRENQTDATLTWTNILENQSLIIVERSEIDNSNFTPIDTVSGEAITFHDTKLPENLAYAYRVRGINSNSFSEYSNESSVEAIEVVTNVDDRESVFMHAFPNPLTAEFTLEVSEKFLGGKLTIIDSKGIPKRSIENIDKLSYQFDLQAFRAGVYIVQLKKGKSVKHLKIIKGY